MPEDPCLVNQAIARALQDAAPVMEERGILVVAHLEATHKIEGETEALFAAIYTLFRGISHRLVRGATLYVRTEDRAGGDVELLWEAREEDLSPVDAPLRDSLAKGPLGDVLELAIDGLERICRARATHQATRVDVARRLPAAGGPIVAQMRRYLVLISGQPR